MIPTLSFKFAKEKRLAQGYLWGFRNEFELKQKDFAPGSLVAVQGSKGRPLGVGFWNSASNLSFRLLAPYPQSREVVDEPQVLSLLRLRLRLAVEARPEARMRVEKNAHAARRLVNSEGDWLSGLIVDQYGDALVLQITSLALEQRREALIEELKSLTGCKAIFERSESGAREKEGLQPRSGLVWGAEKLAEQTLEEGGLKFKVDLLEGQKTGFFLDQRETRVKAAELAEGRECLDVFCHTGQLALSMAKGGAKSVLGIDESEAALKLAKAAAKSNKLKAGFEAADAFAWLREKSAGDARYGLVLLDPPSMAKNREAVGDALRGYKELNLRAIKLLGAGGILVSCSCTQAVSEEDFLRTVQSAAVDAQAQLVELWRGGQPADHPRHPAMPETRYLKAFAFRKL